MLTASSAYHDANTLKACGEMMPESEDSILLKLALQIFAEVSMHAIRRRSIAYQVACRLAYRSPIGHQSVGETGRQHE